jgi:Domain of unknown function (DUF1992)
MSPVRRDGEGRREIGPDWETLIERQIREATEAGAFDGLPHKSERLPLDHEAKRSGAQRWRGADSSHSPTRVVREDRKHDWAAAFGPPRPSPAIRVRGLKPR